MTKRILLVCVLTLSICLFLTSCACRDKEMTESVVITPIPKQTLVSTGLPMPPEQPMSGPGGMDYQHGAARMTSYGSGNSQYWIFEPTSPTPSSAPLIVFNHGWIAMKPVSYGAWIDHLVRRGNIVVYPRYQSGVLTPIKEMSDNAINAVKDAINTLQNGSHVSPELDKLAIVGHSLGGTITVNMAVYADSVGLPKPKAIMLVEPGQGENFGINILAEDLSAISSDILMLVIVGADDSEVGDTVARKVMSMTSHISEENRQMLTMYSDKYGDPPLIADHYAPVAPDERYDFNNSGLITGLVEKLAQYITGGEVDAYDYYGFWKLFDGLTDYAFYGINKEYALGDTQEQRFMGTWSDGRLVTELHIE